MSLDKWHEWEARVKEAAVAGFIDYMRRVSHDWKPAGRGEYLCAIRDERTPSCRVYDDGHWRDYGTGEHGDLISYVRWRDSCTYTEALNVLAVDLGIGLYARAGGGPGDPGGTTLAHTDPDAAIEAFKRGEDERTIYETMTKLVGLCAEMISHPDDTIRTYLRDHYGFCDAFIDKEQYGYVPHGLYLIAKERYPELTENMLMQSGFFIPMDDERPCALGGRILFPYWRDGLVCYTIGRKLPVHERDERSGVAKCEDWDRGKYKKHLTWSADKHSYVGRCISNEQLLYEDCGRHLRADSRLYITEGYPDAAILRMLGRYVMSPVTTSISTRQIERTLVYAKRAGEVIICNDNEINRRGENPGEKGALKMAEIFWAAGVRAKLTMLPRPPGSDKIDVNELLVEKLKEE